MSIPRTPTRLPRILYLPWSSFQSDSCLLSSLSRPSSRSHAKHRAYSHEAHRTRTRQAPKPPRPTRITHSKSKSPRRVRDSQLHTVIHTRTGASQRVSRLGTARRLGDAPALANVRSGRSLLSSAGRGHVTSASPRYPCRCSRPPTAPSRFRHLSHLSLPLSSA